jgi:hypothetical protein
MRRARMKRMGVHANARGRTSGHGDCGDVHAASESEAKASRIDVHANHFLRASAVLPNADGFVAAANAAANSGGVA